mgnify:CR=1 FL=1
MDPPSPLPALLNPYFYFYLFYFIFLTSHLLIPYCTISSPSSFHQHHHSLNRPSPSQTSLFRAKSLTRILPTGRSRSHPLPLLTPAKIIGYGLRPPPPHPVILPHYSPVRLQISALRLAVPRLVPGLQGLLRPPPCLIAHPFTPLPLRRQSAIRRLPYSETKSTAWARPYLRATTPP